MKNFRITLLPWVLGVAFSLMGAMGQNLTNLPTLTEKQDRVLNGLARDRFGGRWVDLTPAQLSDLRKRADAYFENQKRWHLPGGLVASVRFADTNRSQVASYEALNLSAAQTGYLLGAHAFHFVVMRESRSLTEISNLLTGVERLLRSGPKPGFVPCFIGRADDPAYQAYYSRYGGADSSRTGLGKLAFSSKDTNGAALVWLGGTTRDQYAGLNFGLGMVHKLARDPAIRNRCARAIGLILDRLAEDDWRIDEGDGRVTFVTPLLKTALLCTGAAVDPRRFLALYKTNAALLLEQPAPSVVRYSDYGPNISVFANFDVLARLDTDSGRHLQFQQRLTQLWREGESDLNPFFAALYLDAFERSQNKSGALSTLQGMLYPFPPPPRSALSPTGDRSSMTRLAANGKEWSRYALPLPQRPVAPFQWMQSPYELEGPAEPLLEHPGVDFVITFWMARESSVIPDENARPPSAGIRRRFETNSVQLTNLPTAPIVPPKLAP